MLFQTPPSSLCTNEGWKQYTRNKKDIKKSYEVLGMDQRLKILEGGVPVTFEQWFE
ncbi:MAG: hypothetical protein ABIN89_20855 [Chitinophagaceae bacterium]